MHVLNIVDLTVEVEKKVVLDKFNLTIKSGEIHTIMGPNGTGKSTLSKVIMGDDTYKIISGNIYYDDIDITNYSVDERARCGIFLSMQYPVEIEGVTNADFLRTVNLTKNKESFKLYEFIKALDFNVDKLKMEKEMIHRGINVGFSGGERKKNEILQLHMLKPDMAILDEIDSGLDVDSLKIVGENVMDYYKASNCGLLLITHYQRLLNYIKPNFVHIMLNGRIVETGNYSLVAKIEKNGYQGYTKENFKTSTSIVKEN